MHTLNPLPFLALALAIGAASHAFAQAGTVPESTNSVGPTRIPVHTRACEPGESAYGIWGAGRAYKVGFEGDVTFVPVLGRDYPRNQPFAWRTVSVRIGEEELLVAGREPLQRLSDYRVERDHGAVLEAYDVLEQGLEQTFLLREAPRGSGSLVIRGAITSDLKTQQLAPEHGALLFCDGDAVPIVRYGEAVAIDANGDTFPMQTCCREGVIELHLDADAIAAARFPLLVDPLLSTVYVTTNNGEAGDLMIQDESTVWNTMLAYTWHSSSVDYDVIAMLGDESMSARTTVFSDLSTNGSADHARIAFVGGTDKWLIVYENRELTYGGLQLRAHLRAKQDLSYSSKSIGRLDALGYHSWRPAVGGTAAGSSGSKALIVFQSERNGSLRFSNAINSEVKGLLFNTATSSGQWGVTFDIAGHALRDTERPAVNRIAAGGSNFDWMVVYQQIDNFTNADDWELFGCKVNQSGAVGTARWQPTLDTMHQMSPVVAGRDGRYLVAFSTYLDTQPNIMDGIGTALRSARVDWPTGVEQPNSPFPTHLVATDLTRSVRPTGIAFNGESRSHWTVTWCYGFPQRTQEYPVISQLGYRGEEYRTRDIVWIGAGTAVSRLVVGHSDRSLRTTVLLDQHGVGSTGHRMTVRSYSATSGAAAAKVGSGCSAALLSWTGPARLHPVENQRLGGQLSGPSVTGAAPGSVHLLMLATTTIAAPIVHPLIAPGCTMLVPLSGPSYVGMLPAQVGVNPTWQLPLPESLPPITLALQDWIFDPTTGLFYATHALKVGLFQ